MNCYAKKHTSQAGTVCAAGQDKETVFEVSRERGLREYLERYFSLSAREEAIHQRSLYSIEVEITKVCNLECPYCYSSSCKSVSKKLPLEILKKLLCDAYDYGIRSVSWFGGEPLLYPDIFEILEFTKKVGYHESVIYTNGTLINLEVAKRLRLYVDTVAIHLDTLDPELFQKIHFNKNRKEVSELHKASLGSFDSLLNASFDSNNIRLTLTLTQPSYYGLEHLFEWAFHDLHLQTSIFIPLAPFGRGGALLEDWFPRINEIKRAYELRAEYEKRPYLFELGPSEYCKQYQMSMCYILTNGSVTPYAGTKLVCGNVFKSPINEIIANNYDDLAFRRYSDCYKNFPLTGACFGCKNQRYCFGNVVLSESKYPCPNRGEPWCQAHFRDVR